MFMCCISVLVMIGLRKVLMVFVVLRYLQKVCVCILENILVMKFQNIVIVNRLKMVIQKKKVMSWLGMLLLNIMQKLSRVMMKNLYIVGRNICCGKWLISQLYIGCSISMIMNMQENRNCRMKFFNVMLWLVNQVISMGGNIVFRFVEVVMVLCIGCSMQQLLSRQKKYRNDYYSVGDLCSVVVRFCSGFLFDVVFMQCFLFIDGGWIVVWQVLGW